MWINILWQPDSMYQTFKVDSCILSPRLEEPKACLGEQSAAPGTLRPMEQNQHLYSIWIQV